MQPYKRDRFFSSLRQVERRLASESTSQGIPQCSKVRAEEKNECYTRSANDSPRKRRKGLGDSGESRAPNCPEIENGSRGIQSSVPSDYTEFSFSSPINACVAAVCMDVTASSLESDAAPEFLSHSDGCMWGKSSEEAQLGTQKIFHDNDRENDCQGKDSWDFDDISSLCALLSLDGDCLLSARKSHQMDPIRTCFEEQGSSFYSKVAQVKGPKSESEIEALDAWIHHFGSQKKEPFRLVHLLLAKASIQGNVDELDFPEPAQEFLHSWPPS